MANGSEIGDEGIMTTAAVWDRVTLVQGDITTQKVDAIVNAANTSLLGGGGVDGAIHRSAGSDLLESCRSLRGCETGGAKITPGFRLPAKFVIHAVGPVYDGGRSGEPEALASCYRTSLRLASEHACETIAFPAISCGVYAYPLDEAAEIAISTVVNEIPKYSNIRQVSWVLFNRTAMDAFSSALDELREQ
jgi:O-acetyl-ADP-ribose deacetylase